MTGRGGAKRVVYYDEGNLRFRYISVRELVSDPQFQSGYRDRLAGLPPPRFYYDPAVGERDTWGLERGRLVAAWLQATGQGPPEAGDIDGLAEAYSAAWAAGAVL
jgi:hypothetical protein